MRRGIWLFVIVGVAVGRLSAQKPLYKEATATVEERVKDLIGRMTVEEKVGQLCCPMGWEMYTKTKKGVKVSELYKKQMEEMPVGSFWAVLRADPWTQKTLETGLNPEMAAMALNALQRPWSKPVWVYRFCLPKSVRTATWP